MKNHCRRVRIACMNSCMTSCIHSLGIVLVCLAALVLCAPKAIAVTEAVPDAVKSDQAGSNCPCMTARAASRSGETEAEVAVAGDTIVLSGSTRSFAWQLSSPLKAGTNLVEITLKDKEGKPVAGKDMTGRLWMPDMPMQGFPVDLFFADVDGTGVYGCLAQYVHGGLWRISVQVAGDDGKTERVEFDLTLSD